MKIDTRHDPDGYWHAIDRDDYEAEGDSEGRWWSSSPQGVGDTKIGAVRDLLNQIEERASRRHKDWDIDAVTEQREWHDYDRDC